MQSAKEYITRPLEAAEVEMIDRAMQALPQDYLLQRRLERLYGLPSSKRDSRTVVTNRWRLLTSLPQLGLQVSLLSTCSVAAWAVCQVACIMPCREYSKLCCKQKPSGAGCTQQDLFAAVIASLLFCYPAWS